MKGLYRHYRRQAHCSWDNGVTDTKEKAHSLSKIKTWHQGSRSSRVVTWKDRDSKDTLQIKSSQDHAEQKEKHPEPLQPPIQEVSEAETSKTWSAVHGR